jgi:hypothetical protein
LSDPASSQTDRSQPGIAGEDSILKEAIAQLQADNRAEVVQIELAGDTGAPKSQHMWIEVGRSSPRRMSRITVARQVRSSPHDRIAASSTTSSSPAKSSHSPRQACSTSDCSTGVNPPEGT